MRGDGIEQAPQMWSYVPLGAADHGGSPLRPLRAIVDVVLVIGEPSRDRTEDPLIKRRGPASSRPSAFLHSFV
jgi:hypothetical protein